MSLTLTLLAGPAGPRQTRRLSTGTLSIGRGSGNDWVLPDPERHLSKTHCVISAEGGRYVLTDVSTNGIHINGAQQATVRDSRVTLTDGDEFRLGDHVIAVEEVDDAPARPLRDEGGPLDVDPLDDPLGRSPDPAFNHPVSHVPAARRAGDPFDVQDERQRRPLDVDDDLFRGVKPAAEWQGPSQPDHADAPLQAFAAPRVDLPAGAGEIDFDALIGDLSTAVPPPALPVAPRVAGPARHDPPADGSGPLPAAPVQPAAAPAPTRDADAPRSALAAFLDGAAVRGPALGGADPEATLRAAGQVFRAMAEGLREVLMSRAEIKGELRVEQTMVRAQDNNALKFSVTVDEAVAALLGGERPGYMHPVTAAREAFADLKSHELAVMAGAQTALMGLLQRFDPAALEAKLGQGKLDAVLPAMRKARLWDGFRQTYEGIVQESEDDFQAVFGRAFARTYTAQTRGG